MLWLEPKEGFRGMHHLFVFEAKKWSRWCSFTIVDREGSESALEMIWALLWSWSRAEHLSSGLYLLTGDLLFCLEHDGTYGCVTVNQVEIKDDSMKICEVIVALLLTKFHLFNLNHRCLTVFVFYEGLMKNLPVFKPESHHVTTVEKSVGNTWVSTLPHQ